jgi:alkylation response protein AidB-like acyl-CoA dehydrogenase
VRVPDHCRVGAVNGGWSVLREALNAEHGTVERDTGGLQRIATMSEHLLLLADGLDRVAGIVGRPDATGRAPVDDHSVALRVGRAVARTEAAGSTAEKFGRVAIAQALRELTPDLMDVLGAAGALPVGVEGAADAADDGGIEYLFRLASPMGIYGGTLEVFRNMIAQHDLGLGRPVYSPTRAS